MIEEAHKIIRDTIRKQTGSMKTPEQIDRVLNRALNDYLMFLLDHKNSPQAITRYISEKEVNHIDDLPSDMVREISISSSIDGSVFEGDILSEQEFNDRRNSSLVGPEYTHPIAKLIGNGIRVLPEDGNYALLYYRTPIKAKYAYTIAENGRDIVFDEANSVDLDCNSTVVSEVISRALSYLGISLESQNLIMEEQIKNGN